MTSPEPLDINSLIFLDFTSYCIYNMIALSPLNFFHPQSCAKKTFVIVEIYYSSSFGGLVKWVKFAETGRTIWLSLVQCNTTKILIANFFGGLSTTVSHILQFPDFAWIFSALRQFTTYMRTDSVRASRFCCFCLAAPGGPTICGSGLT